MSVQTVEPGEVRERPIEITAEDMASAQRCNAWWDLWRPRSLIGLVGMAVLLFAVLLLTDENGSVMAAALTCAVSLAAGWGIAMGCAWFLSPALGRRGYRRQAGLHAPGIYSIGPDALKLQMPEARSETRFENYLKWRENARVFLLYLSDRQFETLPKRALDACDERLLRQRLASAGVPRR
jgi:hypothetical protein